MIWTALDYKEDIIPLNQKIIDFWGKNFVYYTSGNGIINVGTGEKSNTYGFIVHDVIALLYKNDNNRIMYRYNGKSYTEEEMLKIIKLIAFT